MGKSLCRTLYVTEFSHTGVGTVTVTAPGLPETRDRRVTQPVAILLRPRCHWSAVQRGVT